MYGRPKEARYAAFNSDGSMFDTPNMVRDDGKDADSRYPDTGGFLMAELPYKGEEVSMVLIAPQRHNGLPDLEKLLTAANVDRWTNQLKNREIRIYMPKFSFDTDYHLNETLKQLGITRAFNRPSSPKGADLGGMCASDDPLERLYVSDVFHKARIEVNEKGTEAAAVTIAVAAKEEEAPSVKMIPFIPVFTADRPFIFLIRDTKTGTILFLGRILEPTSGE
jgi:serine protease inhibitor